MLGNVQAVLLWDGDDNNGEKNTTHVISPPKTMIIYDPFPVIRAINPRNGISYLYCLVP